MRRRLIILVLFLLAGALLNIAVAWGCAMQQPQKGSWLPVPAEINLQRLSQSHWNEKDIVAVAEYHGFAYRSRTLFNDAHSDDADPDHDVHLWPFAYQTSAGWPLHAFRGYTWETEAGALAPWKTRNAFCLDAVAHYRIIPMGILWIGLAVNTILYAAALAVLYRALMMWKRHCRKCSYHLRGPEVAGDSASGDVKPITGELTCRKCKYRLEGLPESGRCPECGLAISFSIAYWRDMASRGILNDGNLRFVWIVLLQALVPVGLVVTGLTCFIMQCIAGGETVHGMQHAMNALMFKPYLIAVCAAAIGVLLLANFGCRHHRLVRSIAVLAYFIPIWLLGWLGALLLVNLIDLWEAFWDFATM